MSRVSNPYVFFFSGEHSGDMHAAGAVSALKQLMPNIHVGGVAGPCLREEEIDVLMNMEEFDVMGVTDVIKAFPRLYKHFRKVRTHILKTQPDITVLVDYQDFNLQLSKSLRKHGYKGKIIQYISPTVWAWRAARADTLAKYINALFTIFPFEAKYFSHTPLDVRYIGNPTKEKIDSYSYCKEWMTELDLPNQPIISLFPGSRKSEITHNLPLHLKVAQQLFSNNKNIAFGVSSTNTQLLKSIQDEIRKSTLTLGENIFTIPRKYSFELMDKSTLSLAKSGTVTLELALHNTPTVVTYEISKTQEFIAKHILKLNLPHYCIVNILANKEIFPEHYGANLPVDSVTQSLNSLQQKHQEAVHSCHQLHEILTSARPGPTAAKYIQEMLVE